MANRSRVISTEHENSHASKLIKSLQAAQNLDDFKLKPDGVWGCTAKIKIVGENITVNIDSTKLDLEFAIPFDDDLQANEGEIIVYNLSIQTRLHLSAMIAGENNKVTITAGYGDDTGILFTGYMRKVSWVQDGADIITTIKVADDIEDTQCLDTYDEEDIGSVPTSGKSRDILIALLELLGRRTMLTVTRPITKRNCDYENFSLDKPLSTAIKELCEACGVSAIISNGKIYCRPFSKIDNASVFEVSPDTGMIGSPQHFTEEVNVDDQTYVTEGYDIEMLLQHRLSTGSEILLKARDCKGTFYVKSGEHIFNESECVTKIKAIKEV